MSELDRWQRERYEAAAAAIAENLTRLVRAETAALPDGYYFLWRTEQARQAEERGRQEWISDVKRRLGIVCIGEIPQFRVPWPGGVLGGPYEVISDHTLELHVEWPPECRCVLLDGEQVSLGGPCPVHAGTDA
jgi:hypothetical protein